MSDKIDKPAPASRAEMRGKVLSGTFWFMSGTAARAVMRIAVMAALARILTPADFGVIGAASIFILFADLFATPGIVSTLVQQRQLDQRHIGTAFVSTIVTALAVMSLFVMMAGPIAAFFGMAALEPILHVLAVLLPLNAISAVSQKLLEREMMYKRLATIEVASYVFGYAAISVSLAFAGFGVWALVWAQIGSALVRSVLVFGSQPHNVWKKTSWRTYREMMRNGVGFSLSNYANVVAQKGDYFVVGRTLGITQLGFYERAYVLMELSNSLLTNALSTILFSAFSRLQDDRIALAKAYLRCSAILGTIFGCVSLAAFIMAPEIIAVLLGGQWSAAVAPFRVLAFGMFFRTGLKVASVVNASRGAVYHNALHQAVYAVGIVGGAAFGANFGIVGVAVSTLSTLGVVFTLMTGTALKVIGLGWTDILTAYREAVPPALIVGASAALYATMMRAMSGSPLLVLVAVGILTMLTAGIVFFAFPTTLGSGGRWMIGQVASWRSRSAGD